MRIWKTKRNCIYIFILSIIFRNRLPYDEQLKKKNSKGVSVMAKLKWQLANIPKSDRTERAMKETEWARGK